MGTENDYLRFTIRTDTPGQEKPTLSQVNVARDQRVRIRHDGSECFTATEAYTLGEGDRVKIISKTVKDGEATFDEIEGVVMEVVRGGKELLGEQLIPAERFVEEAEAAADADAEPMMSPSVESAPQLYPQTQMAVEPVKTATPASTEQLAGLAGAIPGAMGAVELIAAMLVQDKRFLDAMMTLMLKDDRFIDGMMARLHRREQRHAKLTKIYQNSLYMASGAELSVIQGEYNSNLMGIRNSSDHPTDPGKPVFFHLTDVQDHGPRGEHVTVQKWVELEQPGTLPPAVHAAFQADDIEQGKKYYIALTTPDQQKQKELLDLAIEEVDNDGAHEKPDGNGAGDAA